MPDIDLSGQPHWTEADRSIMPTVEPGLLGIRRATIGWIGRLRAGLETYAPVADVAVIWALTKYDRNMWADHM